MLHLDAARPCTSQPLPLSHLPRALASVLPFRLIFLSFYYHHLYSHCSPVAPAEPGAPAPASLSSSSPLRPWWHDCMTSWPIRHLQVARHHQLHAGRVLHRHRQKGLQQPTRLFHKDKGDDDSNGDNPINPPTSLVVQVASSQVMTTTLHLFPWLHFSNSNQI